MVSGPLQGLRRDRPAHTPISVRCPHCGAPLDVLDERAQLVVCSHCDSHCELTGAERDTLVLLGESHNRTSADYDLPLGQAFRWEGARYEVVARMHWVEEDDLRYSTKVYVLYHPRRPLLHLDEYKGTWGLTRRTHVQTLEDLRTISAHTRVRTYDGRSFTCTEVVERELWHVDGCVPWIAQVGDVVQAWECEGPGGTRFEIERAGSEIEHNEGRVLTRDELADALPGVALPEPPPSPAAQASRWFLVSVVAFVGILLNGCMGLVTLGSGWNVHTESFTAAELTREVTSEPFYVSGDGLVSVTLESSIDNAWMAVDLALVRDDDTVVHVTDADLSYYHGYSGGESWSEGSQRETLWFRGATEGEYRVHLRAVSGHGDTPSSTEARHDLELNVVHGAHRAVWAVVGIVLCVLLMGFGLIQGLSRLQTEED